MKERKGMKTSYCNQCGQALPPTSRFCNGCGAAVASAADVQVNREAPRPAPGVPQKAHAAPREAPDERQLAPHEELIFTLRPTLIFVFVRYVVAALLVIATAGLMGLLHSALPNVITGLVAFLITLLIGLVLFAFPVYRHILRRREVYTLTNHKLEMRYGILAKIVRNIPLRNIQDVTVTASAWQRLISIGDIEIDSASEVGKIVLDDIHHPERYANIILEELRRRN
jgi:membrane protein YdbS with pleckstrin-like domain